MKKLLLAVLLLFLIGSGVQAQSIFVNVSEDTFTWNSAAYSYSGSVCSSGFTPTLNTTNNYGSETYIINAYVYPSSTMYDVDTFYKFEIPATASNKVITGLWFNVTPTHTAGCSPTSDYFYFLENDSWDENVITGINRPDRTMAVANGNIGTYNIKTSVPIRFYTFPTSTASQLALMDDLYMDSNISFLNNTLVSGVSCGAAAQDTHRCNVAGDEANVSIPKLAFEVADYAVTAITGTDTATTFYDFESGYVSSSYFSKADFAYDAIANILTLYVPAAFYGTELTSDNTLESTTCASVSGYSTTTRTSLNIPFGTYDVFCFNLSSEHNGKQFYGAIKIINNTNVRGASSPEFDFNSGIYSLAFNAFSSPSYSPVQPRDDLNLTITWSTSGFITSNLRARRDFGGGSYGAWVTVLGDNETYTNVHAETIEAGLLDAGNYQLQLFGYDSDETYYQSDNYTFVVYTSTTTPLVSARFAQGMHIITQESGTAIPLRSTVCFQGAATDYQNLCVLTDQEINASFPYGYVEVASFQFFEAGLYNISVQATGHTTFNGTITVISEPHIEYISLGLYQTCIEVAAFETSLQCLEDMPETILLFSPLNISSWYCDYDPDECSAFNGAGQCIRYGMEIGYVCIDGYHPAGIPVNGSVPLGSGQNETTNIVDSTSDFLSRFLGFNTEGTLAMLAIIITIIGAVGSAVATKSGLVGAITFIGLMVFFSLVGWFPLVFTIMLGLLSAFVAVNFLRKGIAGE